MVGEGRRCHFSLLYSDALCCGNQRLHHGLCPTTQYGEKTQSPLGENNKKRILYPILITLPCPMRLPLANPQIRRKLIVQRLRSNSTPSTASKQPSMFKFRMANSTTTGNSPKNIPWRHACFCWHAFSSYNHIKKSSSATKVSRPSHLLATKHIQKQKWSKCLVDQ